MACCQPYFRLFHELFSVTRVCKPQSCFNICQNTHQFSGSAKGTPLGGQEHVSGKRCLTDQQHFLSTYSMISTLFEGLLVGKLEHNTYVVFYLNIQSQMSTLLHELT